MAILQLPNRKTWIAVECKLSVLQSETCCRPVLHHQDTLRPALTPYGACESQTAHIHLAHMPLWDVYHEVEPTQHSPHEIVSSSLSLGSLCSSEPSALLETKQSVSLVLLSIADSVWVHVCCLWWGTVGLWWAIMTKMQGRPPHCLIADSTVTGMKHIWVFYRLKRKYISTNFSHITIFCFISSVEYLTTAVLTSSSLQCFWFSALFLIFLHIIFPSQHLDSNTDTEKVLSNIQEKKNNNNPPKPWHLAPTFTTTTSTANVK